MLTLPFQAPAAAGSCDPSVQQRRCRGCLHAHAQVDSLDEALGVVNDNEHGNGTAIFTRSGAAARKCAPKRQSRSCNCDVKHVHEQISTPIAASACSFTAAAPDVLHRFQQRFQHSCAEQLHAPLEDFSSLVAPAGVAHSLSCRVCCLWKADRPVIVVLLHAAGSSRRLTWAWWASTCRSQCHCRKSPGRGCHCLSYMLLLCCR